MSLTDPEDLCTVCARPRPIYETQACEMQIQDPDMRAETARNRGPGQMPKQEKVRGYVRGAHICYIDQLTTSHTRTSDGSHRSPGSSQVTSSISSLINTKSLGDFASPLDLASPLSLALAKTLEAPTTLSPPLDVKKRTDTAITKLVDRKSKHVERIKYLKI